MSGVSAAMERLTEVQFDERLKELRDTGTPEEKNQKIQALEEKFQIPDEILRDALEPKGIFAQRLLRELLVDGKALPTLTPVSVPGAVSAAPVREAVAGQADALRAAKAFVEDVALDGTDAKQWDAAAQGRSLVSRKISGDRQTRLELKVDDKKLTPELTLDARDDVLRVRQNGDRIAVVVRRLDTERPYLLFLIDAKTGECVNAVSSKEPIRDLRFDESNQPILQVQTNATELAYRRVVIEPQAVEALKTRLDAAKSVIRDASSEPAVTVSQKPPALARLKEGSVQRMYQILASDPRTNAIMIKVLEDADALIYSTGESREQIGRRVRAAWIAACSNNEMRREMVAAILREVNAQSDTLKTAIDAKTEKPYWQTLIIGGGVHAAEVANAMSLERGKQSIVTVEATAQLSSNFGTLADTFRINSSNRQENGETAKPGTGNINPIESPVGVPDISGNKWPSARALADASTIGLYTSGTDFLMKERVVSVQDKKVEGAEAANWPGRYKVKMSSGREVYADQVVVATGIGKATIPFEDEASKKLTRDEIAKVDFSQPNDVPQITTFDAALQYMALSDVPLEPYRAPVAPGGKKPVTAVVGFGDSGKVFLENLFRLAPDASYDGDGKRDKAQRGDVGEVVWFVGAKGPGTCKEYVDQTRARYGQISTAIKSEKIKTVQSTLEKIDRLTAGPDAGRLRLTYKDKKSGKETTQIVDRVVLSTGFESTIGDLIRPTLEPKAAAAIAATLEGRIAQLATLSPQGPPRTINGFDPKSKAFIDAKGGKVSIERAQAYQYKGELVLRTASQFVDTFVPLDVIRNATGEARAQLEDLLGMARTPAQEAPAVPAPAAQFPPFKGGLPDSVVKKFTPLITDPAQPFVLATGERCSLSAKDGRSKPSDFFSISAGKYAGGVVIREYGLNDRTYNTIIPADFIRNATGEAREALEALGITPPLAQDAPAASVEATTPPVIVTATDGSRFSPFPGELPDSSLVIKAFTRSSDETLKPFVQTNGRRTSLSAKADREKPSEFFSISSGEYAGGVVIREYADNKIYNTIIPADFIRNATGEARVELDALGIRAADAAGKVTAVGFETSPFVEKVSGTLKDGTVVPLGKQVKGQDIYLVGPAAGKDVVDKAETAGINENTASIFALGPRSAALGRKLAAAKDAPPKKFEFARPEANKLSLQGATAAPQQVDLSPPPGADLRRESASDRRARRVASDNGVAARETVADLSGSAQLRVRALLADALSNFSFDPSTPTLSFTIAQKPDVSGRRFVLQTTTNIDRSSLDKIREAVQKSPELVGLLYAFTRRGSRQMSVVAPIKQGRVDVPRLTPVFAP